MDTCSILHWLFFTTPLQCCSQKKESSTERYTIIYIFFTIKLLQTIIPTWSSCYVTASRNGGTISSTTTMVEKLSRLLKHVFTMQSFNYIQSFIARVLQFALHWQFTYSKVLYFFFPAYRLCVEVHCTYHLQLGK